MKTIRELNGIKSLQCLIISVIHVTQLYLFRFPIEMAMATVHPDDVPPITSYVLSFWVSLWTMSPVEPLLVVTGCLLTIQTLGIVESQSPRWNLTGIAATWLRLVARRCVRQWSLIIPAVSVLVWHTGTIDGVRETVFFVNNYVSPLEQTAGHLWTSAATIQAAILLPLCIFILSRFQNSKYCYFLFFFVALIFSILARFTVLFVIFPEPASHVLYYHPGPQIHPAYAKPYRTALGVDALVWEGSDMETLVRKYSSAFITYTYFPFHMRMSAFFMGGIVGVAVFYKTYLAPKTLDILCICTYVWAAALHRLLSTLPDRRYCQVLENTCVHTVVGVLIFAAVSRRGHIGTTLSWVWSGGILQQLSRYTFAQNVWHPILGTITMPYLTANLSEPSLFSAIASVTCTLGISFAFSYLVHHLVEVPICSIFNKPLDVGADHENWSTNTSFFQKFFGYSHHKRKINKIN